jgi:hypothetical protein
VSAVLLAALAWALPPRCNPGRALGEVIGCGPTLRLEAGIVLRRCYNECNARLVDLEADARNDGSGSGEGDHRAAIAALKERMARIEADLAWLRSLEK